MGEPPRREGGRGRPISARWQLLKRGAANAVELLREGRLGAPYHAAYEVVVAERTYALRRYAGAADAAPGPRPSPVLFVPPLMVTAEIYDISPELSATNFLAALGVDVWLVDFGAPEDAEGGLDRTLDDHVLAIDASVEHIARSAGAPVHLVGYSQGGMFCYQAAAYRKSRDIRSVITFGAPVDLRRNLPVRVHDTLAERLISTARKAIDGPLKDLQGLPGTFSSRGFKLLAPGQELKHLIGTLGLLHDRDALMAQEPKRRFLGGEGFISWPGPAFRKFVDEFIVNNRMKDGGFIIAGHTVSLADITAPILYFVGTKDDLARPDAVRAIEKAAVRARCHAVEVAAGHFGLVVGSAALTDSWPTVRDWLAWIDEQGPQPAALRPAPAAAGQPEGEGAPDEPAEDDRGGVQRLYDLATDVLDGLWHKLGDVSVEANAVVGALRWQLPRLARLASMAPHSRVSYAKVLAEQAHAIGDEPFFVWRGRAYSYRDAHIRVSAVAAALYDIGVRRGHRVGVLLGNHPDTLTLVGAVNRLGAVSVLLKPGSRGESLRHDLAEGEADYLACDPEHLEVGHAAFGRGTLLLGLEPGETAPEGVVDLDARVAAGVALPEGLEVDAGRASDLATLIFTSGTTGLPKAARITNGRWIAAGLGAANACELTPSDTVYCCLPLYHSTGMLVAVGGALIGGTRLVLAPRFSATSFWTDVRNTGATVVFYVGELLRYLVAQPPHPLDRQHPVRLFAGNGLHADVWRDVLERFGQVRILEFYSATEGNVVLLNRTGDKIGSVGREFTGRVPVACVRYDIARDAFARDLAGHLTRVAPGEPGVLVARISGDHPLAQFAGYTDADATEARVLRDAFEPGDAWFDTGDLLYHDEDGDFFFVDRLGDTFRWKGENVSTELVAKVLRGTGQVAHAAVYGVLLPSREGRAGMAAVELASGAELDPVALFDAVSAHLTPPARPQFLRVVPRLDVTETLKVVKYRLQQQGADPGRVGDPLYLYDEEAGAYTPLDLERYVAMFVS
ncbi:MAG: acyl-CoA synthetase [Deltaproteobacteria bacterium HGW-Deltaproteobacteria-14]|jgi:putative long chain acyl-CoA synthase|nr:MAG: acyl-CoA synthetase [Deltaproteobacteria bacterium HGW-Deltaproteobacteria-14]